MGGMISSLGQPTVIHHVPYASLGLRAFSGSYSGIIYPIIYPLSAFSQRRKEPMFLTFHLAFCSNFSFTPPTIRARRETSSVHAQQLLDRKLG